VTLGSVLRSKDRGCPIPPKNTGWISTCKTTKPKKKIQVLTTGTENGNFGHPNGRRGEVAGTINGAFDGCGSEHGGQMLDGNGTWTDVNVQ
jgi:hypothetical protein